MKLAAIFSLFFIITGCASSGPRYTTFWKKEGVSFDQAQSAHAECKYQVGLVKIDSYLEKNDVIKNCMLRDDFRKGKYLL